MKQTLSNGEHGPKYQMLHCSRQNTIALANRLLASYKAIFSPSRRLDQYWQVNTCTADSEFFGGQLTSHSRRKRGR